jgi:hypothetical protein
VAADDAACGRLALPTYLVRGRARHRRRSFAWLLLRHSAALAARRIAPWLGALAALLMLGAPRPRRRSR